MNENHAMIIKDFIEENWSAFEMRAEEQGEGPRRDLRKPRKSGCHKLQLLQAA